MLHAQSTNGLFILRKDQFAFNTSLKIILTISNIISVGGWACVYGWFHVHVQTFLVNM